MFLNADEWPYLTQFLNGWVYDDGDSGEAIDDIGRHFASFATADGRGHLLDEIRRFRSGIDDDWLALSWTANRAFESPKQADEWLAALESTLAPSRPHLY